MGRVLHHFLAEKGPTERQWMRQWFSIFGRIRRNRLPFGSVNFLDAALTLCLTNFIIKLVLSTKWCRSLWSLTTHIPSIPSNTDSLIQWNTDFCSSKCGFCFAFMVLQLIPFCSVKYRRLQVRHAFWQIQNLLHIEQCCNLPISFHELQFYA